MFLHPLASPTPTCSSGKSTPPHLFCAQSRAKAFNALPVCKSIEQLMMDTFAPYEVYHYVGKI